MNNSRQARSGAPRRNVRIVARGIRRDDPDVSQLMKAALDQHRNNTAADAVTDPDSCPSDDEVES